jgi:hypothetical protein
MGHELGAQLRRQVLHQGRWTTTADGEPQRAVCPRRDDGGLLGTRREALGRQRDRAGDQVTALPEGDVHGPVGTVELGELPGAVERVDDPDAGGDQPDRVVGALLGEDGVVGAERGELVDEEAVRLHVPGRLAGGGIIELAPADAQQQLSGRGGQ